MLDRVLTPITGFGFNGNMGYGLSSVLNGLRGGVISSILKGFANQYPILKPLLGQIGPRQPTSYPPTLTPSAVNPSIPVVQGVPQMQEIPQEVIEQDKEFLNQLSERDAMFANPVDYIRGGTGGNSAGAGSSGLKVQYESTGEVWIVNNTGEFVRFANDTEATTGLPMEEQ